MSKKFAPTHSLTQLSAIFSAYPLKLCHTSFAEGQNGLSACVCEWVCVCFYVCVREREKEETR